MILILRVAALLAVAAGSPFAGAKLFVNPYSNPAQQAAEWRDLRPADAALIDKIARQPMAQWANGPDLDLDALMTDIDEQQAMAVLVLYFIPHRDCGLYSRGGAANAAAYRAYVDRIARALGKRRAAVIVEPDALPNVAGDCLPAKQDAERLALLRYAAAKLPNAYIDAGNAVWMPAEQIAALLKRAGVERARGFALNVSNFQTTAASIAYGTKVSKLVGGKHFVIDTSRNGRGPYPRKLWRKPEDEWCNPPGRALGRPPTAKPGHPLVDAYLWVKVPGESDGECNGAPRAGAWWPEYALGLARRASW